jgi:hypothetical protein
MSEGGRLFGIMAGPDWVFTIRTPSERKTSSKGPENLDSRSWADSFKALAHR